MTQRFLLLALCVLAVIAPRLAAQQDPSKKIADDLRREIELLQKQVDRLKADQIEIQQGPRGVGGANMRWGGLHVKKADAELAEKLGLPEKEGMLVTAVDVDSPADKAGLKANDVIVKLGSKAAPNDPLAFADLISQQKDGQAFDMEIVRDGKEQTIKGAALPNAVQSAQVPHMGPRMGGGFGGRQPFPDFQGGRRLPKGGQRGFQMLNVNGAIVTRRQIGDEFFGSYEKNDLKITVNGKIEQGEPKVTEITIQEGKETKKYTKLADVPAEHRATAQSLMLRRVPQILIFPPPPPFDFPGLPNK